MLHRAWVLPVAARPERAPRAVVLEARRLLREVQFRLEALPVACRLRVHLQGQNPKSPVRHLRVHQVELSHRMDRLQAEEHQARWRSPEG